MARACPDIVPPGVDDLNITSAVNINIPSSPTNYTTMDLHNFSWARPASQR
jgi:hypothetical protein